MVKVPGEQTTTVSLFYIESIFDGVGSDRKGRNVEASNRTLRRLFNWIKFWFPDGAKFACPNGTTKVTVQLIRTDILQRGGWECPWCASISGSMTLQVPIGSTREQFEEVFEGINPDDYLEVISGAVESKKTLAYLRVMDRNLDVARNLVALPKLYELVKDAVRNRKKREKKEAISKKKGSNTKSNNPIHGSLAAILAAGNKTPPSSTKKRGSSSKSSQEESKEKVKKKEKQGGRKEPVKERKKKGGKGDDKKEKRQKRSRTRRARRRPRSWMT